MIGDMGENIQKAAMPAVQACLRKGCPFVLGRGKRGGQMLYLMFLHVLVLRCYI